MYSTRSLVLHIPMRGYAMTDHDLIMAARAAKNGPAFELLWVGNWQTYFQHQGKPVQSQSEADLAFCSMLAFWSAGNTAQMDRIFRQSGLFRAKWDEVHGTKTYGAMTIDKAIALQNWPGSSQSGAPSTHMPPTSSLNVVQLDSVTPQQLKWLWPGFFPLGKVSLLAGNPGLGKSQVTLDIAARVSAGTPWPTGEANQPGRVILISGEDDPADTIVPRLDAVGANRSQISLITATREIVDGKIVNRALSLQRDIDKIDAELTSNASTRLIVIDPISAYLGKADSHNNAEMRSLLDPLAQMAQRHGVAVLLVSHLNKGTGEALFRISGSIGFAALARAVFGIVKDDSDDLHRIMLPIKANLSPDSKGLGYVIRTASNGAPYVEWDTGTITGDDLEAYLAQPAPGEAGRLKEATDWLQDALNGGPAPAKDLINRAKRDGIAQHTLERAKTKLGAKSRKGGDKWMWCPAPPPIPGNPVNAAAVGFGDNL
jgi:putative DNA primase/helicase